MTEEIKEILNVLGNKDKYIEEFGYQYKRISLYDSFQLLDYVTNLQQENEKLKYNTRGQVNDYFKDKYANEVLKKADLIKDFELTCYKNYELKQENEKLKEELKNRPIVDFTFDVYKDLEDYKSRCEKAIEYIKAHYLKPNEPDLLNILQGDDKE